jgi:glycosyltransferase involved in cell wall biosynthesis
VKYHGRSADLAASLGIPSYFVSEPRGSAPLRYVRQWVKTRRLLREKQPNTVIVMQPPIIALLAVTAFAPRSRMVIGDLHSGVFLNPKWRWAARWTFRLLRGSNAAIVTNEILAERSRSAGVRTIVSHDLITESTGASASPPQGFDRPADSALFALVPVAYANDEPIDALLDAAANRPEVRWVLTGRAPQDVRQRASANVTFTGYVSDAEYRWLVEHCAVMLALTTRDHTMQRVGYEAMSGAKALVVSGTQVLRDFFGDAAIYTAPTSVDITMAVDAALERREDLQGLMARRRAEQIERQTTALEQIRALLRAE